jgi:hypothetical protein
MKGLVFFMFVVSCFAFAPTPIRLEHRSPSPQSPLCLNREICRRSFALKANPKESEEEYVNPITQALGKFIAKENRKSVVDTIDWNIPKRKFSTLDELANLLDEALKKQEWFVTGNVDPSFFSDDFAFQDPDVKIKGIKEYAKGVNKIFSQTSRAEVITVRVNNTIPDTLTVTWRLSGAVNLGAGLKIKPYVVYTDLRVSPDDGLIVFQEDRFSIPGYDILLSALFPFLVSAGWLSPPAPSVEELRKSLLEP